MSGDSLLDVMEQIDAVYIEEAAGSPETVPGRKKEVFPVAENYKSKKKLSVVIGIAACLAVLLAATFIANQAGWISIGGSGQKTQISSQDAYWFANAEEMVAQADLIFTGEVTKISQEAGENDLPYAIYNVEIDTVYKGDTGGDTIQVRIFGGESDSYSVQNDLTVAEGGSYLFCMETYESEAPCILNDTQAVFDLTTGQAATSSELDPGFALEDVMEALETLNE
ncbi:MAG: hypothetical protein LUE29_08495 [Lachnospiraceae bacterium]|nr:hypothetical protein [Lachnospiraceae bacterium]